MYSYNYSWLVGRRGLVGLFAYPRRQGSADRISVVLFLLFVSIWSLHEKKCMGVGLNKCNHHKTSHTKTGHHMSTKPTMNYLCYPFMVSNWYDIILLLPSCIPCRLFALVKLIFKFTFFILIFWKIVPCRDSNRWLLAWQAPDIPMCQVTRFKEKNYC